MTAVPRRLYRIGRRCSVARSARLRRLTILGDDPSAVPTSILIVGCVLAAAATFALVVTFTTLAEAMH